MIIDIWNLSNGNNYIRQIKTIAWRIVESQEKMSTRKLVDSLEEQKILDEMIEESKPKIPVNYLKFHPLIYTPFRYPPLKNGSRFGKKTEPSIWYGSIKIETAIAEKAFYQIQFLNGTQAEFGNVSQSYTVFSVNVKTSKGIKLDEDPFAKYKDQISSPVDYRESQFLGLKMRENKVEAFTFYSARDPHKGKNVGLYNINAFTEQNPIKDSFQTWQCNATKNLVDFVRVSTIDESSLSFPLKIFLIDGNLPSPAL